MPNPADYGPNSPFPMTGFVIERAEAYWIACSECNDSELVYGTTAPADAEVWAREHRAEHARWAENVANVRKRET